MRSGVWEAVRNVRWAYAMMFAAMLAGTGCGPAERKIYERTTLDQKSRVAGETEVKAEADKRRKEAEKKAERDFEAWITRQLRGEKGRAVGPIDAGAEDDARERRQKEEYKERTYEKGR